MLFAVLYLWNGISEMCQEEIPYIRFLQLLKEQKIEDAVVTEQVITGTPKPETADQPVRRFVTVPLWNQYLAKSPDEKGSNTPCASEAIGWAGRMTGNPVNCQTPGPAGSVRMETFIPCTLVKRGVKREVITPIDAPEGFREEVIGERQERKAGQEGALVRALGLAHYWQRLLDEGKYLSITDIAAAEGMDAGQVSRIARLARLAPGIVEGCMAIEENASMLENLFRWSFPANWLIQKMTVFPPDN